MKTVKSNIYYRVLEGKSIEELSDKVEQHTANYWICQGGVFADHPEAGGKFYQAMIKHEHIEL